MDSKRTNHIKPIARVPALASFGEYTLTLYPAALKSASSTIQLPPYVIPVTKTYRCYGDVCFKTGIG